MTIPFIDHSEFHTPTAHNLLKYQLNPITDFKDQVLIPPSTTDYYLRDLYQYQVLQPAAESALFLKMNYAKFLAHTAKAKSKHQKYTALALTTRDLLIKHNLRLVHSTITKILQVKYRGSINVKELEEDVSYGNLALFKAVDGFDVARRWKFSTYATTAIRSNHFKRYKRRAMVALPAQIDHLVTYKEPVASDYLDEVVENALNNLDETTRTILKRKFGIGCRECSLEELSVEFEIPMGRLKLLHKKAYDFLRDHLQATPDVLAT